MGSDRTVTFNPQPHNLLELRRALQHIKTMLPPNNYDASVPPVDGADGGTNDASEGWQIGSKWFYKDMVYMCTVETVGAAVWHRIAGGNANSPGNTASAASIDPAADFIVLHDVSADTGYGENLQATPDHLVNAVSSGSGITFGDDVYCNFGDLPDGGIKWHTGDGTNHFLSIETYAGSAGGTGVVSIMNRSDTANSNRHLSTWVTDPTLRIYSSDNLQPNDWIEFYHDQTNGIIDVGNGLLQFASSIEVTQVSRCQDNTYWYYGSSSDVGFKWDTAASRHFLSVEFALGLDTTSGYMCFMQNLDSGQANRVPSAKADDPTLRIYSADADVAGDFIEFYHDQDDGRITVGSGSLLLTAAGDVQLGSNLDTNNKDINFPQSLKFEQQSGTLLDPAVEFQQTLVSASDGQNAFHLDTTISQAFGGGYNAVNVAVTETFVGTGDKNLIKMSVDGTEKFAVDNTGAATSEGVYLPRVTVGTTEPTSPNIGDLWFDTR